MVRRLPLDKPLERLRTLEGKSRRVPCSTVVIDLQAVTATGNNHYGVIYLGALVLINFKCSSSTCHQAVQPRCSPFLSFPAWEPRLPHFWLWILDGP